MVLCVPYPQFASSFQEIAGDSQPGSPRTAPTDSAAPGGDASASSAGDAAEHGVVVTMGPPSPSNALKSRGVTPLATTRSHVPDESIARKLFNSCTKNSKSGMMNAEEFVAVVQGECAFRLAVVVRVWYGMPPSRCKLTCYIFCIDD